MVPCSPSGSTFATYSSMGFRVQGCQWTSKGGYSGPSSSLV